eukprot:gene16515-19609_t
MRFYQIQNPGSGLALLLTRSDRPENRTRPEQVYPHGSLVEVEGKLGGGNVPYVRPKDTSGWLPVTRDGEQTLLPVAVDEGMWAYTVNNDPVGLALRRTPSDRQEDKISPKQLYPHGALVWADRRLQYGNATYVRPKDTSGWLPYGNTTYVRPKDTSGWLFVTRDGEQTLLPVEVEEGIWAYTVNNDPVGLALRRDPSSSLDDRISPKKLYRHGALVWADRRLQFGNTTYVRPKDTSGWLFVTRDGKKLLLAVEEADINHGHKRKRQNDDRPTDADDSLDSPEGVSTLQAARRDLQKNLFVMIIMVDDIMQTNS